jgi:uncharacterized protein (DUF952 family)
MYKPGARHLAVTIRQIRRSNAVALEIARIVGDYWTPICGEVAFRDPASCGRIRDTVPTTVYKICESALWREAERAGLFHGAGIDARDGFIHFSTAAQVRETAAKHFAGVENLMLVAVDADALDWALKWEASRGGELFPHLYGALPLAAVLWAMPLPLGADQRHVFPELAP